MPIFFDGPQDFVHQGPLRCSSNEIRGLLSGEYICKKRICGAMERYCNSGTKHCAWSGLPQLNIRYELLAAICPSSEFFLRYFSYFSRLNFVQDEHRTQLLQHQNLGIFRWQEASPVIWYRTRKTNRSKSRKTINRRLSYYTFQIRKDRTFRVLREQINLFHFIHAMPSAFSPSTPRCRKLYELISKPC